MDLALSYRPPPVQFFIYMKWCYWDCIVWFCHLCIYMVPSPSITYKQAFQFFQSFPRVKIPGSHVPVLWHCLDSNSSCSGTRLWNSQSYPLDWPVLCNSLFINCNSPNDIGCHIVILLLIFLYFERHIKGYFFICGDQTISYVKGILVSRSIIIPLRCPVWNLTPVCELFTFRWYHLKKMPTLVQLQISHLWLLNDDVCSGHNKLWCDVNTVNMNSNVI